MHEVSDPAGPRKRLALATPRVLPSAHGDGVGTPNDKCFVAQYSACTYPCQRFTPSLAADHA